MRVLHAFGVDASKGAFLLDNNDVLHLAGRHLVVQRPRSTDASSSSAADNDDDRLDGGGGDPSPVVSPAKSRTGGFEAAPLSKRALRCSELGAQQPWASLRCIEVGFGVSAMALSADRALVAVCEAEVASAGHDDGHSGIESFSSAGAAVDRRSAIRPSWDTSLGLASIMKSTRARRSRTGMPPSLSRESSSFMPDSLTASSPMPPSLRRGSPSFIRASPATNTTRPTTHRRSSSSFIHASPATNGTRPPTLKPESSSYILASPPALVKQGSSTSDFVRALGKQDDEAPGLRNASRSAAHAPPTVRVLRVRSGRENAVLRAPEDAAVTAFVSCAFSVDAKHVVAGYEAQNPGVVVWRLSDGFVVGRSSLSLPPAVLHIVPQSSQVSSALTCSVSEPMRLLRIDKEGHFKANALPALRRHTGAVTCHEWVRGPTLLVGSDTSCVFVVRDTVLKQVIQLPPQQPQMADLPAPPTIPRCMCDVDGGFALGTDDGRVLVYRSHSSHGEDLSIWAVVRPAATLANPGGVLHLHGGPLGSILVACERHVCGFHVSDADSHEESLATRNLVSEERYTLLVDAAHDGEIIALDTALSKPLLYTLGADKTVRSWDYERLTQSALPLAFDTQPLALSVHPSAFAILVAFRERVVAYHIGWEELYEWQTLPQPAAVLGVRYSRAGGHFGVACGGNVLLYSSYSLQPTGVLDGSGAPVTALAWGDGDATVAAGTNDGMVYLWRVHDGSRAQECRAYEERSRHTPVLSVCVRGHHLRSSRRPPPAASATVSGQGAPATRRRGTSIDATILEDEPAASSDEEAAQDEEAAEHLDPALSGALAESSSRSQSSMLLAVSGDGVIRALRGGGNNVVLRTDAPLCAFCQPEGYPGYCAGSFDGDLVVLAANLANGYCRVQATVGAHLGATTHLLQASNAAMLVSGGSDGNIFLYSMPGQDFATRLKAPPSAVQCMPRHSLERVQKMLSEAEQRYESLRARAERDRAAAAEAAAEQVRAATAKYEALEAESRRRLEAQRSESESLLRRANEEASHAASRAEAELLATRSRLQDRWYEEVQARGSVAAELAAERQEVQAQRGAVVEIERRFEAAAVEQQIESDVARRRLADAHSADLEAARASHERQLSASEEEGNLLATATMREAQAKLDDAARELSSLQGAKEAMIEQKKRHNVELDNMRERLRVADENFARAQEQIVSMVSKLGTLQNESNQRLHAASHHSAEVDRLRDKLVRLETAKEVLSLRSQRYADDRVQALQGIEDAQDSVLEAERASIADSKAALLSEQQLRELRVRAASLDREKRALRERLASALRRESETHNQILHELSSSTRSWDRLRSLVERRAEVAKGASATELAGEPRDAPESTMVSELLRQRGSLERSVQLMRTGLENAKAAALMDGVRQRAESAQLLVLNRELMQKNDDLKRKLAQSKDDIAAMRHARAPKPQQATATLAFLTTLPICGMSPSERQALENQRLREHVLALAASQSPAFAKGSSSGNPAERPRRSPPKKGSSAGLRTSSSSPVMRPLPPV